MNGIINIYKERGYTSFDVIARLRGITRQRKMGHTGTLDPDAEGVLPVCLGTATRVCDIITDDSKCYEAVLLLGVGTDSQDITGNIVNIADPEILASVDDEKLTQAIMSFVGEYDQLPPMFSAVRQDGQRLYELARAGRDVERKPRHIRIDEISIVSEAVRGRLGEKMPEDSFYEPSKIRKMQGRTQESNSRFARYSSKDSASQNEDIPVIRIAFSVVCSKGTYIRTLCSNIGDKLGVYGCVERLMRTRVNIFDIDDAVTLTEAEQLGAEGRLESKLVGTEELFGQYARLDVKEKYDELLRNGNQLYFRHFKQYITDAPSPVRVFSSSGEFLGIYEYVEGRFKYTPVKVFIEKDQ